jgi:DNA-directed RNA polymerase subunit M/transcription elongation factor TFIIS
VKLLLLRCPRCNQALAPGQDDEVIQCPSCRAAVALHPTGLVTQDVKWAAPRDADKVTDWVPFWIFRGKVELQQRLTQEGNTRLEEANELWGQPRDLFVPGWTLPLHDAADLAQEMVERQPSFRETPPPPDATFQPVVVSFEDARKLIGLVVVTTEAERKDYLKSLDFDLHIDSQALWLLPARHVDDAWSILAEETRS